MVIGRIITINGRLFIATVKGVISEKDTLQFLGNYADLKAFIPSSVNLETFNINPRSAAPNWRDARGFEDFQSFLVGLSWKHSFANNIVLHTSVFTSFKENNEPRPFNILNEKTNGFGVRSRVTGVISEKIKWGIGG